MQPQHRLRASGIARAAAEEERAEALFLGERRRTRRLQSAMREQPQKNRLRASGIARAAA
jgi:hypothetical protein